MATKIKYDDKYWSTKPPQPREMVVTKANSPVKHRNYTDGKLIGSLGVGAHVIIDMAELFEDVRVMKVIGCATPPVPLRWEEQQEDLPESEREWWANKSDLVDVAPDEGGDITLTVKRVGGVWSVKSG
jgi:hypothetical protein